MKLVIRQWCIICPHCNCIICPLYMLIFNQNLCEFVYWPQNLGLEGFSATTRVFTITAVILYFSLQFLLKNLFKIITGCNLHNPFITTRSQSCGSLHEPAREKYILNLHTGFSKFKNGHSWKYIVIFQLRLLQMLLSFKVS